MNRATFMKACVSTGDGNVALKDVPVPTPGPGQVLIKVFAAAQNPPDWLVITRHVSTDVVVGHDFAGTIEEIGPELPAGLRELGERVAGFVRGGFLKETGGSFAEYCVADAQVLVTLPNSLSYEDAAGLGLSGFTACQTLWQNRDIPTPLEPAEEPFPILIWGGASSVGQYAIQLAKLSGLQIITTASPKNHAYLHSLGASAVFDYKDPDVSQKIRDYTGNKLGHAVDCISNNGTAQLVADSMGEDADGRYLGSVLRIGMVERYDVKTEFTLVYTLLGKPFNGPFRYPAIPEHYELGKSFAILLSDLLADGKLRTNPAKIVPRGLADVGEWIEYQKDGKVSAEKITYRIADAP